MKFSDLLQQGVLFDSHCHLNEKAYDADRDEVVERAAQAGVSVIIDMPTDIESSKKAIENAAKYDMIYAAVGVDAENLIPVSDLFDSEIFELSDVDFKHWTNEVYTKLLALASNPKVLMIGETGMDNYWLVKAVENGKLTKEDAKKSLERQRLLFDIHIRLSQATGKPMSIHSRNAIVWCLEVLRKHGSTNNVFHSLTPDSNDSEAVFADKVQEILGSNNLIGINGIVTFKNAGLIRNVYTKRLIGLNESKIDYDLNKNAKMLYGKGFVFETDGPFLSPEPFRGERNEPARIINILHSF